MKTFFVGIAVLLGCASAALAQNLFPPITGLTIMEPNNQLAGATSSAATWRVSNYNAPPGFALGNFAPASWGGFLATTGGAYPMERVTYNPGANRDELYQSGTALPCDFVYTGGQQVDEWDLFISPDSVLSYPPLSTMSHLDMAGTVQAWGYAESDATCVMNVSVVGYAVILYDSVTRQNLDAQFPIGKFNAAGASFVLGASDTGWFETGTNGQTKMGGQYGANMPANQFGVANLVAGKVQSINADLLPALKNMITQGAQWGLDTNLANWTVSGAYPGTTVFGHVGVGARFGSLALNAVLAP